MTEQLNDDALPPAEPKSDDAASRAAASSAPLDPSLFHTLIEDSDRVFFAVAADFGELYYLSPSFERVWGRPRSELFANPRSWFETIHPDDRERIAAGVLRRITDPNFDTSGPDYRIVRPDGRQRWLRSKSFACRHEGRQMIIGLIEDVTESRDAEAAVRRDRDLLEVLVEQRTAELSAANERLQREIERRAATERDLLDEQRYLEELLRLQESERRLVSFEIHDGAIQNVVAAKMQVDATAATETDRVRSEKLTKTAQLLRAAIDESRRVIEGLRPQALDDLGLKAAVEDLVNENLRYGLNVELSYTLDDLKRSPFAETMIYRIVQESLTNVRKHAETDRAQVEVRRDTDHAMVVVADAGRGFNQRSEFAGRFGVRGLHERAKAAGGTLSITSEVGTGTVVSARIPLLNPAELASAERDKAAAALQLSRLRLQAILDETTAVIFVKDHEGRYELINRRHEELFHVRREVLIGNTDYAYLPPHVAKVLIENDRRVREEGKPLTLEETVPSDGEMRNYISVKFLIPGEPGNPPSICGIATDITEQKRALTAVIAESGLFQNFMEQSPLVAWIKDAEGRYVFANHRLLVELGTTREHVLGRTDVELVGPELAAAYLRHDRDVLASGKSKQYRDVGPSATGRQVVWQKFKFPLCSASGTLLVGGLAYIPPGNQTG